MAEILAFVPNTAPERRFEDLRVIGVRAGITVRIVERLDWPNDLLVVLDGTREGSTTVAAVPGAKVAVAEVIAHAVLATLEAAEALGSARRSAS